MLDYFFGGRKMPFGALSITFIASWWGAGSALSTADLAFHDDMVAFWYYGMPVLISTFLMILGAKTIRCIGYFPEGGVVTSVVVQYMPSMLGTFVFVGISAAIISTMDSLINPGAMAFTLDLCPSQWYEQRKLMISWLATSLITAVVLIISLSVRSILEISWIASDIIITGVFIPLLVGFVWRRGNSHGAVCSTIVGSLFCLCNHLIILLDLQLPFLWEQHSTTQVLVGALFLW